MHGEHGKHEHGHAHSQLSRSRDRKRLALTLALISVYLVAEVVGGLLANSLALLADAGHMLSDAAALALGLFALWIAQRPATPERSFGYYRAEILAALVNGAALIAISIYILVEAYQRLWEPPEVQGVLMMAIASGGLLVNLAALWILGGGHTGSLNVRAAWLHVLADTLGSAAAVIAGVLVWAFRWDWADPVASALIGLLVVRSAWRLMREAVAVLMEGTPGHIDLDQVRGALLEVPGNLAVHDLHVWTISSGLEALSAHVVREGSGAQEAALRQMRDVLHERFSIDHVTIQIEPPDFEERPTAF